MKIYFAASIRGGREYRDTYYALIQELKKYGEVLSEHFGNEALSDQGDKNISTAEIYERDMGWVREADIVVAEVTVPSLGVGYEIGQAESMGKPVICLYRQVEGKSLSAMIAGNGHLEVRAYATETEAFDILKKLLPIFREGVA